MSSEPAQGETRSSRWWPWLAIIAALTFAGLALTPMLSSGFLGDDVINSAVPTPGTLHATGASLPDVISAGVLPWIKAGRFFPGTAYGGVLFYLVDGNVLILKLVVFGLILADIALLGVLVHLITRSATTAVLTVALVPLAVQIRAAVYHDPVVAFAGLLPLVTCYLLGSLCLFGQFLRGGRRRYLAPSIALYGLALITYEITLAFVILYPALAWRFPARRSVSGAIRASFPFSALAVAAVAAAVVLRITNPAGFALASSAADYARSLAAGADPAQGAYAPSYDPLAIARTLALQCAGSIPFSFALLATPVASANLPTVWGALSARPLFTIALACATAILVIALVRQSRSESTTLSSRGPMSLLVGLGVSLVVLPNVLIALSPRYQQEVHLGIAYLPVFISFLGAAVLGATFLNWLLARLSMYSPRRHALEGVAIAVAIALTSLGALNVEINRRSIETANEAAWYWRDLAATALRDGILDELPAGSTIVTPSHAEFIETYTGVAVRTVWSSDPVAWLPTASRTAASADGGVTYVPSDASPIYYMSSYSAWEGNGFSFVGRLRSLTIGADGSKSVDLDQFRVYVADAPLPDPTSIPLIGRRSPGVSTLDPSIVGIAAGSTDVVRSGPDWTLLQARPGVSLEVGV